MKPHNHYYSQHNDHHYRRDQQYNYCNHYYYCMLVVAINMAKSLTNYYTQTSEISVTDFDLTLPENASTSTSI